MPNLLRVYHFTNAKYGIEDIQKRRLKIARINDLNDPYELLSPRSLNPGMDAVWQAYRDSMHEILGFLCFNSEWNNPIHWSHYADKHRGLCLGFDVEASACHEVKYSNDRIDISLPAIIPPDPKIFMNTIFPTLTTKYIGWSYEKERRMMILIKQLAPEGGHYFQPFVDIMDLRDITIGLKCKLSSNDIRNNLGGLQNDVQVYKAKLSPDTYEVEREQAL